MKRFLKKLTAAAIAVMVFAFAGCGGEDMSASPYLGTWSASTAEYSGVELSVKSALGGEFILTLEDDGGYTFSLAGEKESGKWTETEKGFNLDGEYDFTADGDTAKMEYEGVLLHFEKQ